MLNYKNFFSTHPFSLNMQKKQKWFLKNFKKLTKHHYKSCEEYKKISDRLFLNSNKYKKLSNIPFLQANLFKAFDLRSTDKKNLSKELTSSGTTGNLKSKINLDMKTSLIQSKALSSITATIFKKDRLKIFIIDRDDILKGTNSLSAKAAAIKGFSQSFKEKTFLLDKNYNLKIDELKKFIKKNPDEEFVIFGFTSFIWQKLIMKLKNNKMSIEKNKGILVHGGGWKKMQDQKVSRDFFNDKIYKKLGVKKIYNYYGMVEQTGSIFLECSSGYFHTSIYSEIFIRDSNLKICKNKTYGLIQILSLLPLSYPGHNILTEDIGAIEGLDDCKCGWKGKYFSIKGRVEGTEMKGCSDVN